MNSFHIQASFLSSLFLASSFLSLVGITAARADEAAQSEFFEQKIRPVLVEHCYSCHSGGPDEVEAGLWLDSRQGWEKGGQSGPAIVPGQPEASVIMHVLRWSDKNLAMPPEGKLPDSVIKDFEFWIEQGAYDPRQGDDSTPGPYQSRELTEKERWAFSRPQLPPLPAVQNASWIRQPVDQFVLAKLEESGISPADQASPEQLARRLFYDLTGLPPTMEEVRTFVAASRIDQQQAVRTLVDDLLARPTYGEKWARYWLDCVRYADSLDARGLGGNGDIQDAWRYRDWVVNSFNSDRPYHDFVRDQIAGDILASREWDPDRVIATGVYAIGNWGNGDSDKQKVYTDIVDDQVDLTSRTFLGLTLACARCHDHKFDPLSTGDYYAMAGFFFSSHILERFADPTAGESLMRIDLLSSEELAERDRILALMASIDQQLAQQMQPLTVRMDNVAGQSALVSWTVPGDGAPSFTANFGDAPIAFSTIALPGRSVCVHPSPTMPATLVWQATVTGTVHVSALVADADPNCGDGVAWSVELKDQVLKAGSLSNGGTQERIEYDVAVEQGDLIRLVIAPKTDYFCDSTQVEFTIQHEDQRWDLTETTLQMNATLTLENSPFLVCAGNSPSLSGTQADGKALLAERERLASLLPGEIKCQGLQEGGVPGSKYAGFHDAQIHIRGNYNRLSAVQARGIPAIFESSLPEFEGSGRLALAEWIASEENPLTARVMVNRLWQHHFGRGIIATPNNFGKLGADPTHPELLDWMAVTFMQNGWSIKEMHRLICTSAAYQQSVQPGVAAYENDADNLLFSRQSSRKLTAEELRDSLLAVAGNLDLTPGGKSTPDLSSGRRTLYLQTVRSDRNSYQMLFDGADPNSIIDQRNDSLVAPQALWLMNQPFALNQANRLAEQISSRADLDQPQKLARLVNQIYAREITADEQQVLTTFLDENSGSESAWQKVCHVLLCANEFLFVD